MVLQIFALINPFSSIPVLISAYSRKVDVRGIAVHATFIALVVALAMIFIGPFLFEIFSISIDHFRIAGGIILFLLGVNTARDHHEKTAQADTAEALTSLIATPLLTGPAVISFITIKTYELGGFAVAANALAAFVLVGIVFYFLSSLIPRINMRIVGIMSRILGVFLLAVAVGMLATGIKGVFGI